MLLNKKELLFIFKTINRKTRIRYIFFFFLVISVALGEYFTIAESGLFAKRLLSAGIESEVKSIFGIDRSLVFLILIILTNTGRALISYNGLRLAFISASQVCQKVYKNYLYQDYLEYLGTNSSELISIITTKIGTLATNLILPLISISSASLMMIFICISIFRKAPFFAFFAFFSVFLGYLAVSVITSNSMKKNSIVISRNSSNNVKIAQETVTSFREIKLTGFEGKFINLFSKNEYKLRISETNVRILSEVPRYVIETLIFSIIILLSIVFSSLIGNNDNSLLIASLGSFLYGSQRLLPLAQNTYRSFSTVRSSTFSVQDILKYLIKKNIPELGEISKLNFANKIVLASVGFKYPKSKDHILKDCNISIKKGEVVCIVGSSGSGKSTLMDIMMGLIEPTKGKMFIDGQEINKSNINSWRKNLAHVPQEILLMDDTIKNNIAFGLPESEIDEDRIKFALKISCLDRVVKELRNGINTIVGERGTLLSGGQKQRIGIARAIYQNKEIIFLDEATSALDKKTEGAILKNIIQNNNKITVIIITHRPRNEITYNKLI